MLEKTNLGEWRSNLKWTDYDRLPSYPTWNQGSWSHQEVPGVVPAPPAKSLYKNCKLCLRRAADIAKSLKDLVLLWYKRPVQSCCGRTCFRLRPLLFPDMVWQVSSVYLDLFSLSLTDDMTTYMYIYIYIQWHRHMYRYALQPLEISWQHNMQNCRSCNKLVSLWDGSSFEVSRSSRSSRSQLRWKTSPSTRRSVDAGLCWDTLEIQAPMLWK